MAFAPRFRMGPPPRSFAADAHDCIVVSTLGSAEYKFVARDARPMASSPRYRRRYRSEERGHGARVVPNERVCRCARSRQGQVAARWPSATLDRRSAQRPNKIRSGRGDVAGPIEQGDAAHNTLDTNRPIQVQGSIAGLQRRRQSVRRLHLGVTLARQPQGRRERRPSLRAAEESHARVESARQPQGDLRSAPQALAFIGLPAMPGRNQIRLGEGHRNFLHLAYLADHLPAAASSAARLLRGPGRLSHGAEAQILWLGLREHRTHRA
jgi:hypothetical protein